MLQIAISPDKRREKELHAFSRLPLFCTSNKFSQYKSCKNKKKLLKKTTLCCTRSGHTWFFFYFWLSVFCMDSFWLISASICDAEGQTNCVIIYIFHKAVTLGNNGSSFTRPQIQWTKLTFRYPPEIDNKNQVHLK